MGDPTREGEFTPAILDELVEPLPETADVPEPHAIGDLIEALDGGMYRIHHIVQSTPRVRVYEAVTGKDEVIWLHEALSIEGAADLRRTAELTKGLECPMFPCVLSCFDRDGKTYLAGEPVSGTSFADELKTGRLRPHQIIPILSQVAFALVRLHNHGWAYLGLRPSAVRLSKPLKLIDFAYATRLGAVPAGRYYLAGYSPPELLKEGPIDVRADVYAVGALLFHAVYGRPIAETGSELMTWEPPVPVAGVPQILQRCLGFRETRYAEMEELHRDLLRLARRFSPSVCHSIAAATSIGLEPSRTTNQDAYGYLSGRVVFEEGERSWSVVCVADGMGGMEAGEFASEAAVNSVITRASAAFAPPRSFTPEEHVLEIRRWAQAANEKVCSALEGRRAKGGCTLVCACLIGKRLAIAHVGDCRVYLVRDGEVKLLTRDHSLPMALVLQGEIAIEAVRSHPDRSQVLRSLGDRRPMPDYFIDSLEQATGAATMELQTGDVLLLCSDGVWEPLDEKSMLERVQDHRSNLRAVADSLVAATLRRGAPDNATVVMLRVDEDPSPEEV